MFRKLPVNRYYLHHHVYALGGDAHVEEIPPCQLLVKESVLIFTFKSNILLKIVLLMNIYIFTAYVHNSFL